MFLALVAWLLLSSQCNCQQNFTLFTSDPAFISSNPTPDQVCASADGNDTSVEYRALVVLSNRRDLSAMFPDGSLLLNTLGEVMAYNLSQFLDPQARLALLYDSLSVLVGNNTEFWSGAQDNDGNLSHGNCADFTVGSWDPVTYGTLDLGLNAGPSSCSTYYIYLCAKGNFPQLTPASGSPSDVHVFLTDEVNPHAGFDADVFCKQQSTQSPSPILQVAGLEVQAVAFTARRQNLHAMFPPDASIFDLDGNFLAANSVDFFTLLSPVSIRGSNGAIIDASVRFWTGTFYDDLSGNHSGVTCGDWTRGTSFSANVGTLFDGLFSTSVSCGETARFLCAANVIPQELTPSAPGATYLFFSPSVNIGTEELNATNTPDMLCQAAADLANNSKLDGRQCIALVLTEARPTLETYFQTGPVEDLNNNTLAPNMSDFWANNLVTTRSLTFANGEHIDIDYLYWSGSMETGHTCEDFSSSTAGSTTVGTLREGKASQPGSCEDNAPFLCAALAPPTPAPTSSPTATPTTTAPTAAPTTTAPTTMTTTTPAPSSAPTAVVSTNVTWNGTKTVLALGGGAIQQVEVTISPDVAFGQNGTVEVSIIGNNSNTISTVVSVVFRDANGAALNVTNLTKPIVLGFSLSSSLADVKHCIDANPVESPLLPQCGYYNTSTDTWETNGCSLATVNATWLQCECTHLTDFAVLAPKSNKIVPTDTLDLTPDNIAHNSTGLVAVLVMLAIFGIVFALAWRRDHSEAVEYAKLRGEKQEKWSSFMAEKKKTTFVKQVKIAFQKRHTWLSLVFRRAGTSFKSVDRTFVAMLSVFASMSMSANFHAQDNEGVSRVVSWFLTVIACVVPAQFLMILFVRTGEMGFFEEWEYVSSGQVGPSNKCLAFRFPEQWRYAWRAATLIAVIGMIVYILTMSMRFDLQPYYYCQGEPAKAWVVTWLSAYAITAFGYEPLRLVLLASIAYQMDSREAATLKTLEMTAKDAEK